MRVCPRALTCRGTIQLNSRLEPTRAAGRSESSSWRRSARDGISTPARVAQEARAAAPRQATAMPSASAPAHEPSPHPTDASRRAAPLQGLVQGAGAHDQLEGDLAAEWALFASIAEDVRLPARWADEMDEEDLAPARCEAASRDLEHTTAAESSHTGAWNARPSVR